MKKMKKIEEDQYLYTICDCISLEHTVRYSSDTFNGDPELSIEMLINDYDNLWQRIKKAFKFIFIKEKYGASVVSLITIKDVDNIIRFLESYKSKYIKWEKKNNYIKKIRSKK